jgi:hypothetical protein
MRTDGRYDPGEDPPFDHDPFGPSAPPRGAAAPGLGLGPPWALPLVAGVLALVFIAAMLWLYTGRGAGGGALAPESAEVLPLIPAPSEPARLEPEPAAQPPADSAVFETFAPGPGAPAPPASVEPPQDAPETPAAEQAAEAQSVPADQNAQTQDAAMGAAIAPPPAKPARASAQAAGEQVSPETLAFVQSVLGQEGGTAPPAARPRPPAPTPPAAPAPPAGAGGRYYVQLASVDSASGAAQEWARLVDAFPAQLAGAPHRVERADLGARGVFHRLQAGPFDEARARALCEAIKAQRPGGCLVVRPQ